LEHVAGTFETCPPAKEMSVHRSNPESGSPTVKTALMTHHCGNQDAAWIGKFDMRDLGAVLEHEEPLPHRSEDQAR
jgi:hypothetical protein